MTHVHDWMDCPPRNAISDGEKMARLFLEIARMPAWKNNIFQSVLRLTVYCTWKDGERYRVTGASRLGDVWLNADLEAIAGYTRRVDIAECTDWGTAP